MSEQNEYAHACAKALAVGVMQSRHLAKQLKVIMEYVSKLEDDVESLSAEVHELEKHQLP